MLSKKKIESISNIAENTNLEVEGRSLWQDAKNRFVYVFIKKGHNVRGNISV